MKQDKTYILSFSPTITHHPTYNIKYMEWLSFRLLLGRTAPSLPTASPKKNDWYYFAWFNTLFGVSSCACWRTNNQMGLRNVVQRTELQTLLNQVKQKWILAFLWTNVKSSRPGLGTTTTEIWFKAWAWEAMIYKAKANCNAILRLFKTI